MGEPPASEAGATRPPAVAAPRRRPLLLIDIDGVVSLFGFSPQAPPPEGAMHWIDGLPHFLSTAAARHLRELTEDFELAWCSGWEERANEYLPHLLDLPHDLPFLRFERPPADARLRPTGSDAGADPDRAGPVADPDRAGPVADPDRAGPATRLPGAAAGLATTAATRGHWKLAAIDAYAGRRPLAWIDDCLDEHCRVWAQARPAPTLLVQTAPALGLTEAEALTLRAWATKLERAA